MIEVIPAGGIIHVGNGRQCVRLSGGGAFVPVFALQDDFTDDRAAGAINGTLATDGVNARTVTDGASKASISQGALYIASAGSAANPRVIYPQLTRAPGMVAIQEIMPVASGPDIGFSSGTTGTGTDSFRMSALITSVRVNGSTLAVGAFAINAYQRTATVLRSSGAMYFVRDADGWKLLYFHPDGTYDPYPQIGYIGTVTECQVNYLRVTGAGSHWLPTPLASDGFGSAFGSTDGLGHPDSVGLGAGGSGKAWTSQIGTWTISSGKAAVNALGGGLVIATVDLGTADVNIRCNLTRTAGAGGLVLRYTDANNYLYVEHDGTNAYLKQVLAGSTTTLKTAAATYGANRTLCIHLHGQVARIYYHNAAVSTETTAIDASLTSTLHGIRAADASVQIDNFIAYAWSSAEYAALDRYTDTNDALLFAIGDSKTQADPWVGKLATLINAEIAPTYNTRELVPRFGVSGYDASEMKPYIDANLAAVLGTPKYVTINLGANDVEAMPTEAAFKANLTSIIDSVRAKWPTCLIYIAHPWKQGEAADLLSLNAWIDDVMATYSSGVYAGIDERIFLENGDDGATYTSDGVHYLLTDPTQDLVAAEWLEAMGL